MEHLADAVVFDRPDVPLSLRYGVSALLREVPEASVLDAMSALEAEIPGCAVDVVRRRRGRPDPLDVVVFGLDVPGDRPVRRAELYVRFAGLRERAMGVSAWLEGWHGAEPGFRVVGGPLRRGETVAVVRGVPIEPDDPPWPSLAGPRRAAFATLVGRTVARFPALAEPLGLAMRGDAWAEVAADAIEDLGEAVIAQMVRRLAVADPERADHVPPLHRHDPPEIGVGPHPERSTYGHRVEATAQGAGERGSEMRFPRRLDETLELVLAAMTDRPPVYVLARGETLPISARLDDLRLRVRTATLPGFGRAGWPVGDPDALSNLAILHDRIVQVDAWRKAGPLAPAQLERFEAALGVTLPGPLRRFLTTITAGVPADLHGATWFAAHDWTATPHRRWPDHLARDLVTDAVRSVLHPEGPPELAIPVDVVGPLAEPGALEHLVRIYTLDDRSGAALPHAFRFVVTAGPWAERVIEVLDFGAVVRVRRDDRPLPTWLAEAYLEMLLDAPF